MNEVVMVSGVRTPIGSFGGSLKDVSATELGRLVVVEAIKRAGIEPGDVQDVLVGNCMWRSDEINVARCIALKAGIPHTTPAVTIQRQCSSSMQALVFGAQQIMTGENDCVLIGGVESMSNVGYMLKGARWGHRLMHGELTDMLWEGLTDPIHKILMGVTAENLAERHGITRQQQDELAYTSHHRAEDAWKAGRYADEVIPVDVPQRKGPPKRFEKDEHIRLGITMDDLVKLPATFKKNGTVTAGNASGINDGASAAIIMSAEKARKLGKKPLATLVSHAAAGVEPELMGYGPVPATKKALVRAGMTLKDIQLIEVNEAFAAQYLACEKLLELDRSTTNVNGSGIALGHPVGATGLRIVITLAYEMARRGLTRGMATLCVGGGMGKTVIIRRD
ncbi:MAG: acetyl-CoA C-acetyltransferase [Deltaproteobacteria bacterium]|nr:acetyl-CoA C-acetyltransferase [Deltaproteobacteria bacterium]